MLTASPGVLVRLMAVRGSSLASSWASVFIVGAGAPGGVSPPCGKTELVRKKPHTMNRRAMRFEFMAGEVPGVWESGATRAGGIHPLKKRGLFGGNPRK